MLRSLLCLSVLTFVAASCSSPPTRVDAERFHEDVAWMADDARGGRQTGSPELDDTAGYVAAAFAAAGTEPLADDSYLQPFEAQGGRLLLDESSFSAGQAHPRLRADWIPFASSANGEASGPLVFAGYGISDPERGYDDYEGLDVEGKLVLVLRRGPGASSWPAHAEGDDDPSAQGAQAGAPEGSRAHGDADAQDAGGAHGEPGDAMAGDHGGADDDPHGAGASGDVAAAHGAGTPIDLASDPTLYLDGAGQGKTFFSAKINEAFRRGAAGVLIVNDPAGYPAGSDVDSVGPYRGGQDGVAASIPSGQLTAQAGIDLLDRLGFDLVELQRAIDAGGVPRSFPVPGTEATLRVATEPELVDTANVVGVLPGNDPALAHETIVVGAHMDHLGLGGHGGSLGGADAQGEIHNGADDNASGTAGLMGVAAVLGARADELRRTVVFVAFSGEEWGLLGSRFYLEEPVLPADDIAAMVNMDMIGRAAGRKVTVEGTDTSPGFEELVTVAAASIDVGLVLDLPPKVSPNSDHAPFHERGIPVFNFFTGLHPEYHHPKDDVELINADDGAVIASLAAELTFQLANLDERPVFVAPPPPPPADPHSGDQGEEVVSGYRVVFGSSPDMSYQEEDGVKIGGVRPGTPAEKCGLRPGDRIVALDGRPVRNLEDYSVLLFSHQPGDRITVTVVRDGETLELEAVLGGRGER